VHQCGNYAELTGRVLRVTMSPVILELRVTGCQRLDFAYRAFDVTGIPMDAVALLANSEALMCRVDEWRHAAHYRLAWDLFE
jgi:hypothetical protein